MQGRYEAKDQRLQQANLGQSATQRRIVRGNVQEVVKKGRFLDNFSFKENCFVRIEENICWQTQLNNEQLELFDVLSRVDLCVRPTHIIAEHALIIFTIRHQRVVYFLAVELIPTGEKKTEKDVNTILNYVVLKHYPDNVKIVNYYTIKPRTKVDDLVAHGMDFLIKRGGIYNLLKNNCFHYAEHILEACCEDYDKKAHSHFASMKEKGVQIALTAAMAIITLAAAILMAKNGNLTAARMVSRFKFIR